MQSLANLLWGYAKLSSPPPEPLFRALAARAARLESQMESRHVAGVLWALATLKGAGAHWRDADLFSLVGLLARRANEHLAEGRCNSQVGETICVPRSKIIVS